MPNKSWSKLDLNLINMRGHYLISHLRSKISDPGSLKQPSYMKRSLSRRGIPLKCFVISLRIKPNVCSQNMNKLFRESKDRRTSRSQKSSLRKWSTILCPGWWTYLINLRHSLDKSQSGPMMCYSSVRMNLGLAKNQIKS